ncbi:mechanosensitive ion channel protein MscS [Halobiforma lacisalsi AJ5]|uniref:Mechanosensitive ion channel protein MscS n=1 Tax=Natronobacterium lacisalsi AJ5 TaxID=358396 RepID=M0L6M4_NATLA|nr:mechanosensitive ion channel family protein [Halobiforma lacisalsi]APW98094.1 mechanosensitive ion channel protein MscS [Halobiforma lacisalsi AJ5]EMA28074.1 mechanosensitive ion channel protein MscS [Halobiforma lacisalsi AJ5]
MSALLTGLDWLSRAVEPTELRLAVTVAAVGLLLVSLFGYRRVQRWITERSRPLYGDIVAFTLLTGACLLSLAIVVGVWGQTSELQSIYAERGLGGEVIARAIVSFILLVATYIFVRFLKRVLDEVLGSATAVTDHQREITHRMTQVLVWSVSLVVVLGVWIDDLGGLLVGAGFLGIVVGMAARQTLGTVLAGFVLMFARPFEIGDWIVVEDEEGLVTDISIVNTRIKSFDGEYIMIPNDVIASSTVTNRSRRGRLRVEIDVGVDYDADVERAADLVEGVLSDLDRALDAPAPQVVSKEFGDSSVVLGARFWIDKPSSRRRWQARTAAINAIKREFDEEGVDIPYPQRELSSRERTDVRLETPRGTVDGDDSNSESEDGNGESREYRMSQPEDH